MVGEEELYMDRDQPVVELTIMTTITPPAHDLKRQLTPADQELRTAEEPITLAG